MCKNGANFYLFFPNFVVSKVNQHKQYDSLQ